MSTEVESPHPSYAGAQVPGREGAAGVDQHESGGSPDTTNALNRIASWVETPAHGIPLVVGAGLILVVLASMVVTTLTSGTGASRTEQLAPTRRNTSPPTTREQPFDRCFADLTEAVGDMQRLSDDGVDPTFTILDRYEAQDRRIYFLFTVYDEMEGSIYEIGEVAAYDQATDSIVDYCAQNATLDGY